MWNSAQICLFLLQLFHANYLVNCSINMYLWILITKFDTISFISFCSHCSGFGQQQFFQLAPVSIWCAPLIVCVGCHYFFSTYLFFLDLKWSWLILHVSWLCLRISCFSEEFRFLLLESGTGNQDLGTRYACYYWSVTAPWPSQLTEPGNHMHTLTLVWTHFSICNYLLQSSYWWTVNRSSYWWLQF